MKRPLRGVDTKRTIPLILMLFGLIYFFFQGKLKVRLEIYLIFVNEIELKLHNLLNLFRKDKEHYTNHSFFDQIYD